MRPLLLLLLVAALAVSAVIVTRRRAQETPPRRLEVSLWYWRQPFHIPDREASALRSMGVRQLFVRAGTFGVRNGQVCFTLPQQWKSGPPDIGIQLVFNYNYDVVRQFEKLPNQAISHALLDALAAQKSQAQAAGLNVVGVQLDLDSPTRLLPKYAALLQSIRPGLNGLPLSVTALPTWFMSPLVQQVVDAVDFTAPQFYEAETPRRLDHYVPLSRLSSVAEGMRRVARCGKPFYVGLPAYGHALVYNDQGDLMGAWHDLGLPEAARNPAFHLERAFPANASGGQATPGSYIGEDIYDFTAEMRGSDGMRKPYHFVYDVPTPVLLEQHLALVRRERPSNCAGVILFRYPEPGEASTLPMSALQAVMNGTHPRPQLRVKMTLHSVPWDTIERDVKTSRMPTDLVLSVTNVGAASTFLGSDTVTVTLSFDTPGLDDVEAGDFDDVKTFLATAGPQESPSTWMPCSRERANRIRFTRLYLGAGETAEIGPIRIPADGPGQVSGAWTARDPGGFETEKGTIEVTRPGDASRGSTVGGVGNG